MTLGDLSDKFMYIDIIDITNQPMRSIYFRLGREMPLQHFINKLRDKVKENDYTAARELFVIYRAIGYVSRCSVSQLLKLAQNDCHKSALFPKYFKYTDPITRENGVEYKFELVKKIFIKKSDGSFSHLPVFEMRISNIKHLNFVIRCIFFYTNHKMYESEESYNWQCYTSPFTKIVKERMKRQRGTKVTNLFGHMTYRECKAIMSGSHAYDNEFLMRNLIS